VFDKSVLIGRLIIDYQLDGRDNGDEALDYDVGVAVEFEENEDEEEDEESEFDDEEEDDVGKEMKSKGPTNWDLEYTGVNKCESMDCHTSFFRTR